MTDMLDVYDPDPDAETADAADKFRHEHHRAANDNPNAPRVFSFGEKFYWVTAQELFDLRQREWKQTVEDDLHHAQTGFGNRRRSWSIARTQFVSPTWVRRSAVSTMKPWD